MKLTEKEIEILKKGFNILEKKHKIEPLKDEINEDLLYIFFPFPNEKELEVELEHLIPYFNEIETLKIHNYNKVTTDTITQRVISVSEYSPIILFGLLYSETKDGIYLDIKSEPFLIGIAATEKGEYNEHHLPCSSNLAVEVKYPDKASRLSDEEETKLIKSYLFELSHKYKIGFSFSTFKKPEEFDKEKLYEQIDNSSSMLTEDYTPAMDLFIKANQSISDDLKFLTYYKIFEYFAPLYSKIDAYNAMRKKLDSSNATFLNASYIASIFDLTKNYEKSIRDKELVKSLINNTFDLIDIYQELPISIRKEIKILELEYKTKKEIQDRVVNHIGNVLYSTRNGIVHAKSNFEEKGIECHEKDLEQLNNFMHKACYSSIKWYNRLPKHLKIT